jgi:hypothetical protein
MDMTTPSNGETTNVVAFLTAEIAQLQATDSADVRHRKAQLYCSRSLAYQCLGNLEQALQDCEEVCATPTAGNCDAR